MATAAQTLRELHRLHVHVRNLKAELDQGPSLFKAQQAKLARAETILKEAQDHLNHLKATMHEKEVELKSTHQQIAKYEKQLNEAGAKKEYDALQHEIAACRQTGARLEDEILAIMAEIDETTQKLPGLDANLKQVRDETAGFDKEAQERIARLTADLQETTAHLVETEKQVPANVRALYERLVLAHGADALAAVRDKTCSICYSTVTAQQLRELEAGVVSLCMNCGRMLFLAQ
jgi:predicted  nucleic acid-binding Zn-ribbon protein